MQSSKEFFELLTKAKDMRLNIAIFLVSSSLLYAGNNELLMLESISKNLLHGLFFITSIRLVYGLINLLYGFIENRKNKINEEKELIKIEETKRQDRKKDIEKMKHNFEKLDIFQLYIIQELKRQNHVSVKKGASLFTLKNSNIIYTPAVGDKYESASLSVSAKSLLESEIWSRFDELKTNALVRFFDGMQPEDARHFLDFLEKDSINTKRYNPHNGSYYYENERVFTNYTKSIVFTQPQRSYTYIIDPIAKGAIKDVLFTESIASNG
jgi:hypothetical protein